MWKIDKIRGEIVGTGLLLLAGVLIITAGPAQAVWENSFWSTIMEPAAGVLPLEACSDEQGGTLVASVDYGESVNRVRVSRIDHTGNEIWGNEGIYIPVGLSADSVEGPVGIGPDGSGGAFVGYGQVSGTNHLLMVAHLDPVGSVDWQVQVGDFMADNPDLRVEIVATGTGECIAVWSLDPGNPAVNLRAARVTAWGSVAWTTDTGLEIDILPNPDFWIAESDGLGGVLIASNHTPFGGNLECRVQRLNGSGSVLWGTSGTLVFSFLGLIEDLVPDGAGGCFALSSQGYGDARGQHLDSAGAPGWAAGGILIHDLATYPNPCSLSACADGSGGFYLVQGVTDLVGQRVDGLGTNLWGATGITLTSLPGFQQMPQVAPDGFGGMLLTYQDHYFSEITDNYNRALSAMRLDGFGTKLWQEDGFYWTLVDGPADRTPNEPVIVPDGSGGGQVLWKQYVEGFTTNDINAAGLGPDGAAPAAPKLTYIWPDAGSSGDGLFVSILGDYLDPAQTFAIDQGGASFALTSTTPAGPTVMTGDLDISGAPRGPYELVCDEGGGPLAVLPNAFGVGDPLPCADDFPSGVGSASLTSFGSLRKAAVASDGQGQFAWIQDNSVTGKHEVHRWFGDEGSPSSQMELGVSYPARDLAFALDPSDGAHFAFVVETEATQNLDYFHDGALSTLPVSGGVRSPAMVVDAEGVATIVYETDIGGLSYLFAVTVGPHGWSTPVDLGTGPGASEPDLTFAPGGLALTFVRDFWFPGFREVCYQLFENGAWQVPVGMYLGVTIKSPTVAWDLDQNLLFAFVLDNTGSDPLLHTAKMTAGVLGQVRWRLGDGLIYRCIAAASQPDRFFLMTQESETGIPMKVYVRDGDGEVFYSRRRVNTHGDVDWPIFAAQAGGQTVVCAWEDYQNGGDPFSYYYCRAFVAPVKETPVARAPFVASPNPFNPQTNFTFSLEKPQWVKLDIYNVRGQKIRTIQDGPMAAGLKTVPWNGKNEEGISQASGVYFGRLQTPSLDQVTKVTLIK